jgi:acetylornithine/succinyldiaminopimelate/putrescine aminotransferase
MFRQYKIVPDAVVVGKGMTAGFHGQAATIFQKKFDLLEQFDALSTNGNAPLACLAALANIREIIRNRDHLKKMETLFYGEMVRVAEEFPDLIESAMGQGLLCGFKFRDRDKALMARDRLLEHGLWVRVHAYKPNHRTLMMKFALCIDEEVMDFFFSRVRAVFGSPDRKDTR